MRRMCLLISGGISWVAVAQQPPLSTPLKALDAEIAQLYTATLKDSPENSRRYVEDSQKQWKAENAKCPELGLEDCLLPRYQGRVVFWKSYRIAEGMDPAQNDQLREQLPKVREQLASVSDLEALRTEYFLEEHPVLAPLAAGLLRSNWLPWVAALTDFRGQRFSPWLVEDGPCWVALGVSSHWFRFGGTGTHNDVHGEIELDIAIDGCNRHIYAALFQEGSFITGTELGWAATAPSWHPAVTRMFSKSTSQFWGDRRAINRVGRPSSRVPYAAQHPTNH